MSIQEKIQEIIQRITPPFEELATYAFVGEGELSAVIKSFTQVYEAYQEIRSIVAEVNGDSVLNIAAGATLCNPEEQVVGEDNSEMDAAYAMVNSMGMLPPPLLAKLPEFTMQINHYFIAAQSLE